MNISLPYLWVYGHLAAVVGAVLLLAHLLTRPRIAVAAGTCGGALSCAFLGFVLFSIEQSFFGIYRWLAWLVAFLAGYAVVGLVTHAALLIAHLQQRHFGTLPP
jgi:hypothetical protein